MIGYVTSGGPSPSLGMSGIAIGYLENFDRKRYGFRQVIRGGSDLPLRSHHFYDVIFFKNNQMQS